MDNQKPILNKRRKLVLECVNDIDSSGAEILRRIRKIIPSASQSSVYTSIKKLVNHGFVIANELGIYPKYKLSKTGVFNEQPKQIKVIRSIGLNLLDYLKSNVGKNFTTNDIVKHFNLKSKGNTAGDLRSLYTQGFLIKISNSPLTYKVLGNITEFYNKQTKKTGNITSVRVIEPPTIKPLASHNEVTKSNTAHVEYDSVTDTGNIINAIIELEKQNHIYKSALEHIANILSQANIIDDA